MDPRGDMFSQSIHQFHVSVILRKYLSGTKIIWMLTSLPMKKPGSAPGRLRPHDNIRSLSFAFSDSVNEPLGRKVIGLAQYHDVITSNHKARTSDFVYTSSSISFVNSWFTIRDTDTFRRLTKYSSGKWKMFMYSSFNFCLHWSDKKTMLMQLQSLSLSDWKIWISFTLSGSLSGGGVKFSTRLLALNVLFSSK